MADNLSPATFLALQMHAKPRMFAVLLGSGVSRAAQIPTGWDVVTDLVRLVAVAAGRSSEVATADPEAWWRENFDSVLGYSQVLQELAPTQAARAALVSRYFEPTDEQRERGELQPTSAHRAIAELVRDGYVSVILTTNFDNLMEQALDGAGVSPQVLTYPGMVAGMDSLHLRPTVVKLHGDYREVTTLNITAELDDYPEPWTNLLRQVFTDYGLLVSGWSAAWDGGLRESILSTPTRRYPLYWDSRSSREEHAQRILVARGGEVIDAPDADALFTTLLESVRNLERSSSVTPLEAHLAVAAAKRYLATPSKRIELAELLDAVSEPVREAARAETRDLEERLTSVAESAGPLLQVLVTCVRYGEGWEIPFIVATVRDLLTPADPVLNISQSLQSFGATLATYAIGLAEQRYGDRGILLAVLLADSGKRRDFGEERTALATNVCVRDVIRIDRERLLALARFAGGPRWHLPACEIVAAELRAFGGSVGFDAASAFEAAFDDVDYRIALVLVMGGEGLVFHPGHATARWMLQDNWTSDQSGEYRPRAELRFRAFLLRDAAAWRSYLKERAGSEDDAILRLRGRAERVRDQHN